MEHVRELIMGETYARVIFRELPYSGIGYVTLRGDAANRDALLSLGALQLLEAGAKKVFCGFKNDGQMKLPKTCGFEAGEQFYSFVHELDTLSIELAHAKRGSNPFAFAPVSRDNARIYQDVYNEAFAQVPNLATCADDSIDELLGGSGASGELALYRGEPVGVLEISVEAGVPHLDGIALLPECRGKGLGRELLRQALARFADAGYASATLMVSTANPTAYGLYLSEGFVKTALYARWFRLEDGE